MIKVMKFTSQDAYMAWADERQAKDQTIDEIVCIVDEGFRLSIDLTTKCARPTTAIRRLFKQLHGIPELEGWDEGINESISHGYYSDYAPKNFSWGVEHYGDDDYDEYYVYINIYREAADTEESEQAKAADEPVAGATYAGEPVTLDNIAHEFSRQHKFYDERWGRAHRDTTDCIIEFHFQWNDSDGFEHSSRKCWNA